MIDKFHGPMFSIIADKYIPFIEGALDSFAHVEYLSPGSINNRSVKMADALIVRSRTICNESLLKGTDVKFIASATIGHDHIDKDYCSHAGIGWTNAPGCNASSVAQYVTSAMLNIALDKDIQLSGLTIGVIGVGAIGTRVARMAHQLGLKVLLNDPPRQLKEGQQHFVDLDFLLSKSDIVSLHVPLNLAGRHKTRHLVSKDFLSRMKQGSYLINTSRGEVVNGNDLLVGISEGLGGAVLDVWEDEPAINDGLLNSTIYGTPHIAGYSIDGKANGTAQSVRAISGFFNLGIPGWYPSKLPLPENNSICFPPGLSNVEMVSYAINSSYDIRKDSTWLKTNPTRFEWYRDNYPFRREFGAFNIRNKNIDEATEGMLNALGFECIS